MKVHIPIALAVLLLAGPAFGAVKTPQTIKQTVSAEDINALYTELGASMTTQKRWENGDVGMIGKIGEVPVSVVLFGCESNQCSIVTTLVMIEDPPVTLDFLNTFNRETPIGKVVRVSESVVGLILSSTLLGGVTREHLASEPATIMAVLQRYVSARAKVPGASVSLTAPQGPNLAFSSRVQPRAATVLSLWGVTNERQATEVADWLKSLPAVNLTAAP